MSGLGTLLELDATLARQGFEPLTAWWRAEFERFYAHPTARTWGARVGRGGAKSTHAVKFAVNETLFGDWYVPPGERHYFAFVSLSRDEAAQRLLLLEAFLKALGLRYSKRQGDLIDLDDMPRGFRVFPCTVGGTSGFRCFGAAADEVAKWRSGDSSANPADEVVTSVRAMMVTHPGARLAAFSSPLGYGDWHAKLIDAGSTDRQVVSEAPTWIANPTITEEHTRALEPDERKWRREYAAIPQAAALAAFDSEAIDRCFIPPRHMGKPRRRAGIIDASSGKKDTWAWAVCGWNENGPRRLLVFDAVEGIEGGFWHQLSGDAVVSRVASAFRNARISAVHGDQRESLMLKAAFQTRGFLFYEHPWSGPAKERAVEQLRRWLADDVLVLPDHPKLRRELYEFEERITPSGGFTFGARGSGHDDFVALLLTAAMAEASNKLDGSPRRPYGTTSGNVYFTGGGPNPTRTI